MLINFYNPDKQVNNYKNLGTLELAPLFKCTILIPLLFAHENV